MGLEKVPGGIFVSSEWYPKKVSPLSCLRCFLVFAVFAGLLLFLLGLHETVFELVGSLWVPRNATEANITATNATKEYYSDSTELDGRVVPTTDFFVMLPGRQMDARNQGLLEGTRVSVLKFYDEEFLHMVYNTGDPTYLRNNPNESLREGHIVQNNNFALGGFAAAVGWMEKNRPNGNFIILQHSVSLVAEVSPPVCDIELANLRQRCGGPCPPSKNQEMLTGIGTSSCFPVLNEVMDLYNTTCGFPCCPFGDNGGDHIDIWPLMAHNAILFTPRARDFLRPLADYVASLPPGHVKKNGDQGTERLFGLFSTMLLHEYGVIYARNATVGGKTYTNALKAFEDGVFLCSQDLTTKSHGKMPGRRRLSTQIVPR